MGLDALEAFCRENGMALARSQVDAFLEFRARLYELNKVTNLTRVPFEECEARHFIDSLLVAEHCPSGAKVLDLGTGAGFPAWPLACARPDLLITAMDSSRKAEKALSVVPLPNLRFRLGRGEEVSNRESYDVVTGRAFAPLSAQLEVSAAWAKVGGLVVPFRTTNEAVAVNAFDASPLGLTLEKTTTWDVEDREAARLFPCYRKTAKTPKTYPRTWAQLKKRPLA
jgi:16S rRNA (guanine527-N7)-methyltransferase